MPDFKPEQLWPLFEKLPEDLKEAIFAEKTAENISDICQRNKIEEEKVSGLAKYTGYVLLGVLTPGEFEKVLEEDLKLEKETVKKVSWEISRLIFLPVKSSLEKLYREEIATLKGVEVTIEKTPPPAETKPGRKDIYREPIE
jgi:hypothetical protein